MHFHIESGQNPTTAAGDLLFIVLVVRKLVKFTRTAISYGDTGLFILHSFIFLTPPPPRPPSFSFFSHPEGRNAEQGRVRYRRLPMSGAAPLPMSVADPLPTPASRSPPPAASDEGARPPSPARLGLQLTSTGRGSPPHVGHGKPTLPSPRRPLGLVYWPHLTRELSHHLQLTSTGRRDLPTQTPVSRSPRHPAHLHRPPGPPHVDAGLQLTSTGRQDLPTWTSVLLPMLGMHRPHSCLLMRRVHCYVCMKLDWYVFAI
jgi:hypothetical protein